MQVTAASTTATSASNAPTTSAVTQKQLGQNDFLKLLAAQLGAQDPMAPTDNTQFISQMANFSSLQQMSALNKSFTDYANGQKAETAPQYLGKQITVTDPYGREVSGIATACHVQNGAATLTINDQEYSLDAVTSVALPNT